MLRQADYARYGDVTVAVVPDHEDRWQVNERGCNVGFGSFRLEFLMNLRGALNELHEAIFGDDGTLKRLAPPRDVGP